MGKYKRKTNPNVINHNRLLVKRQNHTDFVEIFYGFSWKIVEKLYIMTEWEGEMN